MKKRVSILLWILAFILTLAVGVYQRMTGPTHPVRGKELIEGKVITYKLWRSFIAFESLPVEITAEDRGIEAFLEYRRYKADDPWTEVQMKRTKEGTVLKGEIPGQPAAGKVEYRVTVSLDKHQFPLNNGENIVARFKGQVPKVILAIHVLLMFGGMLLVVRTGLEALRKEGNYYRLVNWTLAVIFIGGLILGPIVQKYAFGHLWTGFPLGSDLTDNKTLVGVLFWVFAFFLKKKSKWWVLAAVILMLIVYLIPHSVMGSELDYKSGKMKNVYSSRVMEEGGRPIMDIGRIRHR